MADKFLFPIRLSEISPPDIDPGSSIGRALSIKVKGTGIESRHGNFFAQLEKYRSYDIFTNQLRLLPGNTRCM